MMQRLAPLVRSKWLWGMVPVVVAIWFFAGRLLMEFDWRDLDFDATDVADIRREIAGGQTGPRLKSDPCMMHQATVDLDLRLDGPFPLGPAQDLVMEVLVSSDTLMVDRLYLGPPTRQLLLPGLPVCLAGPDLPVDVQDNAAFARLSVDFVDIAGGRYLTFTGEEAFPLLMWRRMAVDWSVVPWFMARGESYSGIMVTPR